MSGMLGPRGVGNELLSPALLQMEQVHVSQMVGHDAQLSIRPVLGLTHLRIDFALAKRLVIRV